MKTLRDTKIAAIKLRARKVQAHPEVFAKFLELAKADGFPHATNGNHELWRKHGQVASARSGTDYFYLIVKTVWNGGRYTTHTTIEKVDNDFKRTEIAHEQVEHKGLSDA